ncbi:MAG: ATP-binding protein [Desulfobulbaceae bacterium]|nr:ATP-binding protein [Desulfobulbaceae bacterium]
MSLINLGTTTIALYLCNMTHGEVVASLSVKNPQVLYGDDVMSRIGAVAEKKDTWIICRSWSSKPLSGGVKSLLLPMSLR